MIWTHLIFSFFTAIALVAIFTFFLKVKGPWGSFWFFFLIIFLITFSGVRWLRPGGYDFGGFYWVPSFIIALIVALLIAALTPRPSGKEKHHSSSASTEKGGNISKKVTSRSAKERSSENSGDIINSSDEPYVGISAVFWILIITLSIAAIAGVFN